MVAGCSCKEFPAHLQPPLPLRCPEGCRTLGAILLLLFLLGTGYLPTGVHRKHELQDITVAHTYLKHFCYLQLAMWIVYSLVADRFKCHSCGSISLRFSQDMLRPTCTHPIVVWRHAGADHSFDSRMQGILDWFVELLRSFRMPVSYSCNDPLSSGLA